MKKKPSFLILFLLVCLECLSSLTLSCRSQIALKEKDKLSAPNLKSAESGLKKKLASDLKFVIANSDQQLLIKTSKKTIATYPLLSITENGIQNFAFTSNNHFLNLVTTSENIYSFDFATQKLKKIEVSKEKVIPLGFISNGDKLLYVEIPKGQEGQERFTGNYFAYSFKNNQSVFLFKDKLMFLGSWLPEKLYLNDIEGDGSEKSDIYLIDLKTKKKILFLKSAQIIGKSPNSKFFLLFRLSPSWYEKSGDASHGELWLVNQDGSNLQKIALTAIQPNACFFSDGSKIAFLQANNFQKGPQLVIFDFQSKSQKYIKNLESLGLEKLYWIDPERLLFSTNPYAGNSFVGLYLLEKDKWVKIFDNAFVNQVLKVLVK